MTRAKRQMFIHELTLKHQYRQRLTDFEPKSHNLQPISYVGSSLIIIEGLFVSSLKISFKSCTSSLRPCDTNLNIDENRMKENTRLDSVRRGECMYSENW